MDNGRLRPLYLHLDFTRGIASRGRSDGGEHNGRFPGLFNAAFPGWSGVLSQAVGGDNGRSGSTLWSPCIMPVPSSSISLKASLIA